MNSLNEYDTIEYDFDYYGPAHTVTIGWLMVATNTMTYRLISSHYTNIQAIKSLKPSHLIQSLCIRPTCCNLSRNSEPFENGRPRLSTTLQG